MSLDHEAIRKAYSDAVTINDDTGAFKADGTQITLVQSDIDAARATLDAEYAALEYSRNRAAEYPSIEDQLDDIYHNGIDAWKATIKTTKDKYPKPS
jgi:L-ascorbate metabolism protein UlaG (beta-lactamase superfamily)